MIWFLDTSALAKRYVNESGSLWLRQTLGHHQLLLAQITPIEMMAALGRRFHQGSISQFTLFQARRRFLVHRAQPQYQMIDLTTAIVEEAMRLAVMRELRAYDAVQLASALIASNNLDRNRFTFLTADSQLEKVAQAEGLLTENPLNY